MKDGGLRNSHRHLRQIVTTDDRRLQRNPINELMWQSLLDGFLESMRKKWRLLIGMKQESDGGP